MIRSLSRSKRGSSRRLNRLLNKEVRKAESVISVLKKIFGNNLTSKKRRSQRNELHLRAISHNIGKTNLTTIKKTANQLFCHNQKKLPISFCKHI